MIIPALIAVSVAPIYLLTTDMLLDRLGFIAAGHVRRRRHLRPEPELPGRALPDRGARDRERASAITRGRSGAASCRRC